MFDWFTVFPLPLLFLRPLHLLSSFFPAFLSLHYLFSVLPLPIKPLIFLLSSRLSLSSLYFSSFHPNFIISVDSFHLLLSLSLFSLPSFSSPPPLILQAISLQPSLPACLPGGNLLQIPATAIDHLFSFITDCMFPRQSLTYYIIFFLDLIPLSLPSTYLPTTSTRHSLVCSWFPGCQNNLISTLATVLLHWDFRRCMGATVCVFLTLFFFTFYLHSF